MRHVRWRGVILGTVVALLVGLFLPQVTPDFYAMIAYEQSVRGTSVMTTESQTAALEVWLLVLVATWSLAYLIGGAAAGAVSGSYPGFNGVMTVLLGVVAGAAWVSWTVLELYLGGTFEGKAGDESLGLFYVWAIVFLISLPVIVLAGFLGGRLGGTVRRRVGAGSRS
jgi:hypothetical protein